MEKAKKFTLLFVLTVLAYNLSGQINRFGVPIIKNYTTEITMGSEQAWCITKDKFGNIYFGNQEKGVTRFDGTKWSNIKIGNNSRIYSLASDDKGVVYVGSAYEFGYLQPDHQGNIQYVSLAKRIDSIPKIRNVLSIKHQKLKSPSSGYWCIVQEKPLISHDTVQNALKSFWLESVPIIS